MLKRKDQAVLRTGFIQEQVERSTGLCQEQIQRVMAQVRTETIDRMKQLGIFLPIVKSTPGCQIETIETGFNYSAYRCFQKLKGKGVNQNSVVGLLVIAAINLEEDDRLWMHTSLSRSDHKMPTYDNLCWMKGLWFKGKKAIQVFPPENEHISHHPTCLHLFGCLEDSFSLPNFARFGTI